MSTNFTSAGEGLEGFLADQALRKGLFNEGQKSEKAERQGRELTEQEALLLESKSAAVASHIKKRFPSLLNQEEDVASQAKLSLVESIKNGGINPKNLEELSMTFFTTATRRALDAVRKMKSGKRGGEAAGTEISLSEETNGNLLLETLLAAEGQAGNKLSERLRDAMKALEKADPRAFQIVKMTYEGGFTQAEIATKLKISPITVTRDLRKALEFLRELMESK